MLTFAFAFCVGCMIERTRPASESCGSVPNSGQAIRFASMSAVKFGVRRKRFA